MTMERNKSTFRSLRVPESSASKCVPSRKASTSVSSPRSFVDLSSMPIEIKETVVNWIYLSGETGNDLVHLRSLALVDRTFYQLCSAYLHKCIVLIGASVKSLTTLQPIVQRHSHHVRWLYWRASYGELHAEELVKANPGTWDDHTRLQWDPKTRSELLLEVLKACPRLEELDIDLDPLMWCYDHKMMNEFIEPISQLSSLVKLTLTSLDDRPYLDETLLAKIISHLHELSSFQCSEISASAPKTSSDQQPCQSPLGLQLASLPRLTKLTLELADCFDVSWTWLTWKSSLEELHLFHCDQASIDVLYSFTKLFACTLVALRLHHVPALYDVSSNDDRISQDFLSGKLAFELPKLKNLSVSNVLPVGFLRSFHASKNLSKISLCEYPELRRLDVTAWLQNRVWPNLKEFNICHTNGFESIHTLTQLAAKLGVTMCLNGKTGELDDRRDVDSREEDLSEDDDEDTGKGDLEILNEIEDENTDGVKNKRHENIEHEDHDDDTPEQIQDVMKIWTHESDYEEEVEISDPRGWNQPDLNLSDSILK